MIVHRDMQFTTYDRAHDLLGSGGLNCAEQWKGGWWYQACHTANLNGLYLYGQQDILYAEGMVWLSWKGYSFSLKKTEMKIRPTSNNADSII